ncbi:DMT family transporter [Pseudooceanicola antarcticus]|nr:EamA/RhaT family transporter [Pseudooceanicola antarcticus]
MLAFSGLVAGSFPLGSMASQHVDPAALTALRLLLAAVAVGSIALMRTGMSAAQFRAPWRYLLLGGLFGAYFVLMFEGLKTTRPVSSAAMFTLVPLMSAGFGWLLLRQITTARIALALSIGAAGALWVVFDGDPQALLAFEIGPGEKIYFFGCVAHAIYTPLVPRLNRGEPTLVFTFGTLLAGALVVGAWALPEILSTQWLTLPAIVWITLVYVAIIASAVTGVLLQFASMRLPAAKVMAYTYLTPSWVILWQAALGRGLPPAIIFGGVALTVVALLLLLKE